MGRTSKAKRWKTSPARLAMMAIAVLSLFASGGLFAHAEEIAPRAHAHVDGHDHPGDDPVSPDTKSGAHDEQIHCGSYFVLSIDDYTMHFPRIARQGVAAMPSRLAGRPLVPEPPPPRNTLVFQS